MDILSSTGLYGWITSLIRRRGHRKDPDSTSPNQPNVTISTISNKYNALLNSTTKFLENENKCTVEKEILPNRLEVFTEMDKSSKSGEKSKENSIEEDIEEVISVGSIAESSSNSKSGAKLEGTAIKKRQLFDIDDDDNFAFDDDQLSGRKLAEHFKIDDDVSSEKSLSKRKKSRSKRSSKRSLTAQKHEDQPSLTNQSTTHDVSELGEENSLNPDELYTRSLDLGNVSELSYEQRDCRSLDTVVKCWKLTGRENKSHSYASVEKDRSLEEVVESNRSVETTFDDKTISSIEPEINKRDLQNKVFNEIPKDANINIIVDEPSSAATESGEDITGLKQKILAMTPKPKSAGPHLVRDLTFEQTDEQTLSVKPMERVQADFSKEVLEDITEESEKISAMQDRTVNEFDSIISLNMIQMIELEGKAVSEALAQSKETSLDSGHRRESYANNDNRDSLRELPPSGRDSCSLATTSTEYRTILEELGTKGYDFHTEITRRDNIIDELRVSLDQSIQLREQLQQQSEKLAGEVQQLRKYFDTNEKPYWPRDQESTGQRLSEISLDLVSESDEDYNGQLLTDEEKVTASSRNSKERQLGDSMANILDTCDPEIMPISRQIEPFQKYLNKDELRIFFMVQKKFDDFLSEEIEKSKMKYDGEIKVIVEQLENDKREREIEINRLQQLLTSVKNGSTELIQLRQELEAIHAKEMDELRWYFQQKCADLEKQYSEEVFSQKSQRNSNDTNSDISDQENLPEESIIRSKEGTPRKKTREELYASPSHRQIIPVMLSQKEDPVGPFGDCKIQKLEPHLTTENINEFYKEKIEELTRKYEGEIRKLKSKLKRFEAKYAADEFMKNESNTTDVEDNLAEGTSTYLIIDEDEDINESQEIRNIVAEYERRLQQQVALAKEDTLQELGRQIQALISESTTDDQHWPQEIILLREKFTAKSQLEITQLQIKHEEEMSRLKVEYEKQLNRKIKRNSTFDLSRDLDQIVGERESLRELSNTFRYLLSELAKYVSVCEDDLNNTLVEELHKIGVNPDNVIDSSTVDFDGYDNNTSNLNQSYQQLQTTLSKKIKFAPDISGLLSIIEDPELVEFITKSSADTSFNLKNCLEKLNAEANTLLQLSEDLFKKRQETDGAGEKNDSCEEEDGLKSGATRSPQKVLRAISLNGDVPKSNKSQTQKRILLSLPPDLNRIQLCSESILESDAFSISGPASELNFQVHELKNRLLKSESDRHKLQAELDTTIKKNIELGVELNALRDQLEQLDSQKEDFSEGYGLGELKSPPRFRPVRKTTSFSQLQEKARNILSTPTKMSENTAGLLQLIEDFCREGDKVTEQSKKDRDDLQSQIEAADKQLKSTRQFLDEQAAERELEREDFVKEIENLKNQIRDKEKERSAFEIASREITKVVRMNREAEQMDQQIKDLAERVNALEAKKEKLEVELEASVDKIFVLRDIISDLETQVQAKTLNERVMAEKVKELEVFIDSQNHSNEALQQEVISLKSEIGQGYQERITQLEEQLRNMRPSSEQSIIFGHLTTQLRDIETSLDQKIKTLEALHQSVSSVSCSTSPTEDVSVQPHVRVSAVNITPQGSPMHPSPKHHSLPMEEMQRVFDKLAKHTRVEEAAIKRIQDLEMHIDNLKTTYAELQNERDVLQERMSDQMARISSLQSKLEEQRRRAEEIQCQGTSELNIRIHDLQNEVMSLKETLSARDKQIINLKNHLEQSKAIIDRQEAELSLGIQGDRNALDKLENELKQKSEENKKLREKIKNEMIHKLALPDLMETMLADKNEEIDHLKEQLDARNKELQGILAINLNHNSSDEKNKSKEDTDGKLSGRTLSDIVSIPEFDEPDIIRRAAVAESETPLPLPATHHAEQTLDGPKQIQKNGTQKHANEAPLFASFQPMSMQTFDHPHYFQMGQFQRETTSLITPPLLPRQINFSDFVDDTKLKESTPRTQDITGVEEIKGLKENLKEADGQIANLKKTLENVESEKKTEISKLREAIDVKSKLLDELMVEKSALEKKIEHLNDLVAETGKLRLELDNKTSELVKLEEELKQHRADSKKDDDLKKEIETLKKEVDTLNQAIKMKDEMLSKQEKNLINCQQNEGIHLAKIAELEQRLKSNLNDENAGDIKEELDSVRADLSTKVIQYEKCLLDIQAYEKELEELKETIQEKDSMIATLSADNKNLQNAITTIQNRTSNADSLNSLKGKLKEEQERITALEERNTALESEIERLRSQNSDNSKPFSLDEIAAQVEKELNYSVQLDTNILKAIESEEEADFKTDNEKLIERDLMNQLQSFKVQLEKEKTNSAKIQQLLKEEKQHSQEIQQQDAEIVQAMRVRLEEALQKEQEMHKLLDEERDKCERLSTQISVLQRVEARKTSMLLKSPPDSPRKSPRTSDSESEAADRLKSEIKLLQAQNGRERDRVSDLQRALEREKSRFDTEINERIEYAEKLKREMDKLSREKESAEQETDHLQERLTLASREIESLETRISALQEAETRRAHRRGREKTESVQNAVEVQELKTKIANIEGERDRLSETIILLRSDVERGAQREAKLAEALANSGGDSSLPQQFLQKMKEMNNLLSENTKENRQMVETIQVLIEERKILQRKVEELENETRGQNYTELEERANHLFGKYLRVESHRKALVHQKRYLLIVLRGYTDSEAKAVAVLSESGNIQTNQPRRHLFKTVALAVIAIQRMKFIVKRWHSGKRLVSRTIFNIPLQRKPAQVTAPSLSPPCRDTTQLQHRGFSLVEPQLRPLPLQTPGLITDYSQKFDWSRLKK